MPLDLEARIAELDERLRQAREDDASVMRGNYSRGSDESPAPVAVGLPLISPAAPPQTMSPWRDVAKRTISADDEEMNKLLERQRLVSVALDGKLQETHSKLRVVNATASQLDSEFARTRRHRDVVEANVMRTLDDAEKRLLATEHEHSHLEKTLNDTSAQKELLERQLEDTRAAIRRAELRLAEAVKDQDALHSKHREHVAALHEQNRRSSEEAAAATAVRRRLEMRIAELSEENKAQTERLRKAESVYAAQQASWCEEECSLAAEIQTTTAQVDELLLRLQAAELELREREQDADSQRKLRERRMEDLLALRAAERLRDAERNVADTLSRETALRKEREEAHALLRQQLDELFLQIERRRRVRDAQQDSVAEMKRQIAQLQLAVDEKSAVANECNVLEGQISELERKVFEQRSDEGELRSAIERMREEITTLRSQSRVLKEKLEEESKLKLLISETAKELMDAERRHEEELAALERQEAELQDEKRALQASADIGQNEVDRFHQDAAIELDVLSRRIAAVRQEVSDREAELHRLLGENAVKQSTIAQYEEERRRLEREQSSRKASAAQAARAALSELAL